MITLMMCCTLLFPQSVTSQIDWAAIEEYTLYEYQYEWHEDSKMVGWLQYWLGVETDNVYGLQTHRAHRQQAMQNGKRIPTYNIIVPDQTFTPNVEQWRETVTQAILANGGPITDVPRFLRILECESRGDPNAYNAASGASGLMQHLERYWPARADKAGYTNASPFNAEANIHTSAWLIYRATGGGWSHWVCT